MQRIFITGSNRGIGLATIREYLAQGDIMIFAACRNPDSARDLQELAAEYDGSVVLVPLEVTDGASIQAAVETVSEQTDALDVVINNAGIDPPGQDFDDITAELMLHILNVNTVAPMMISKAFCDLLKKGNNPRLVQISSRMASQQDWMYGGDYGYCSSKTGLNMMMRGLAVDLKRYGIINIALDPGWTRTDMGGPSAAISPEESGTGIVQVINDLKMADNGRYLAYDGREHPW